MLGIEWAQAWVWASEVRVGLAAYSDSDGGFFLLFLFFGLAGFAGVRIVSGGRLRLADVMRSA